MPGEPSRRPWRSPDRELHQEEVTLVHLLKAAHQRRRQRCERFASSEPLRGNCNGGKQKVR